MHQPNCHWIFLLKCSNSFNQLTPMSRIKIIHNPNDCILRPVSTNINPLIHINEIHESHIRGLSGKGILISTLWGVLKEKLQDVVVFAYICGVDRFLDQEDVVAE